MFKLKTKLCTNCRICELACVWAHGGGNGTALARVRISDHWPERPGIRVCLSCRGRECMAACPEEALFWEGYVVLDSESCTGCGACVEACPAGGIHWNHAKNQPLICDACHGAHACVKWCPTGAISLGGPS